MNNPDIKTTFGAADPTDSPLTVNELLTLLNRVVSTELVPVPPIPGAPDTRLFYIVQQDAPGPDFHDYLWIQIDSVRRPIAIKTWVNGGSTAAWRRVYNGMIGEIRGFFGAPGYNTDIDSFDTTGKGNIGGRLDGWCLCNGQNATPDLSNQFLLGANTKDGGGYTSGWEAKIHESDGDNNYKTGGFFKHTLALNEVPRSPTPDPPDPGAGIPLYRWKSNSGQAGSPGDDLYGVHNNASTPTYTEPPDAGNTTPKEFWTTPPFYVLAWMMFKGY